MISKVQSFFGRAGKTLFSTVPLAALGTTQHPIQWVLGALSPGLSRPGSETDRSSAFSANVDIGGAVLPLPNKSSW
jgi:hypothetical protein